MKQFLKKQLFLLSFLSIPVQVQAAQSWHFQARGGSVAGTIDRPETETEKSVQINFGGFESVFGFKKFLTPNAFQEISIKYLYDTKLNQFTRESYQYKFGYLIDGGAPSFSELGPSMMITRFDSTYWAFIISGSLDSYTISSKKESSQKFKGTVVQTGMGFQYGFRAMDQTHITLEATRENFSVAKSTDRIIPTSLQFSMGVNRQI